MLNCLVTFYLDFCVIQDLAMRKRIGLRRMYKGLYYLPSQIHNDKSRILTNNTSVRSNTWHQRLGHPFILPMKYLNFSVPEIVHDFNNVC